MGDEDSEGFCRESGDILPEGSWRILARFTGIAHFWNLRGQPRGNELVGAAVVIIASEVSVIRQPFFSLHWVRV